MFKTVLLLALLFPFHTFASKCPVLKLLSNDNVKLEIRSYGSGDQPVILVHGGPAMPGYMKSVGDLISKDFCVYEYFQRDFYRSPISSKNSKKSFTLDAHLTDLNFVVNAVKTITQKRPIILGHSWGAVLTTAYAETGSQQASKIILLSSGPLEKSGLDLATDNIHSRLTQKQLLEHQEITTQLQDETSSKNQIKLFLRDLRIIMHAYYAEPRLKLINQYLNEIWFSERNLEVYHSTFTSYFSALEKNRFEKNANKIKIPIRVIHGSNDVFELSSIKKILNITSLDYKDELITAAGHMIWQEKPKELKYLIYKFINN